ncbi:MAG TPA: amidohydrolase family protein [Candidatus Paceibacterota bacterium]|nr:amidohydrolase family protein [Candidatus Paceibacterota bacterium]
MTLLIRNVRILGGAGEHPGPCDVFVSGEKISAIGSFPDKKADEALDGQGAYLSPGFIDVNTDSDHYLTLFDHPGQEDFLRQGVTTIFGGMCGASLAPLLYGTLESVRKWGGSEDTINVDWHTMAEFLAAVDQRPFAVNFGTLAGHGTMRRAIVGDDIRALTQNELAVLSGMLRKAMEEGAFGLSTNLGAVHAQKASYPEIRSLAQIVKDRGGIYATHLRRPGAGMDGSVEETIRLARDTGVKALVNHFVPVRGAEKDYEKAFEAIEMLPAEVDVRFDIYPFDAMLSPFYTFLPEWVRGGGFEVMLANIREEWLVPKILKEMQPIEADRLSIAQAPGNDFLVGKTLADLCGMYGVKDGREALLKLMVTTKMRGVAFYRNLDGDLIKRAMASKRAFIASNAASFGVKGSVGRQLKSERTTSTFVKFLKMAEDENFMPLADAIRKITLEPAVKFGLIGRGEIKEGNYADLACFKNGEVKFTVVNGKVVVKDGEFLDRFPGKALRHV